MSKLPNLTTQSTDITNLSNLYYISNLLNAYVITNMLAIGQGPQVIIKSYINPNLYEVAVQYYGDADYWPVIASANNLSDPFPVPNFFPLHGVGYITLLIPPKPSISPAGILNPPPPSA